MREPGTEGSPAAAGAAFGEGPPPKPGQDTPHRDQPLPHPMELLRMSIEGS